MLRLTVVTVVTIVLASSLIMPTPRGALAADVELSAPVLMYHRVAKAPAGVEDDSRWVAPDRFEAQLRLLRKKGWRAITARKLVKRLRLGKPIGPKRFVISIDDGFSDSYQAARPILGRLRMKATYCINPGKIGASGRMTWEQVRRLHRGRHEIANHSLTHADLTAIGKRELTREIWLAQRRIEDATGRRPVTFCYPFGRQDETVRRKANNAGITLGLTARPGGRHSWSARLMSPRIRIDGSDRPADVLRKVRPYRGP